MTTMMSILETLLVGDSLLRQGRSWQLLFDQRWALLLLLLLLFAAAAAVVAAAAGSIRLLMVFEGWRIRMITMTTIMKMKMTVFEVLHSRIEMKVAAIATRASLEAPANCRVSVTQLLQMPWTMVLIVKPRQRL